MLRKIKKWYFKIYHLFKLLGIFILIFGLTEKVYAEEYKTCFDKYKVGIISKYDDFESTYDYYFEPIIPVDYDTTYYIRLFPHNDTNFNLSNPMLLRANNFSQESRVGAIKPDTYSYDLNNKVLTFKNSSKRYVKYFSIGIKKTYNWQNYVGSEVIMSTNIEDVMECEDTPAQDSVYSSFLTLYTDKISYLAEGFTKNPYLLTMIGIIFSFVVLELFLKILHLKGSVRK